MKLIIQSLAICLSTVTFACGQAPAETSTSPKASVAAEDASASLQTAAKDFITLLQQEKYDDAVKQFDATMRQALPSTQLKSVWQGVVQASGMFEKFEPARVNHIDKWDVVDTPCVFQKSTVVVRISFDAQRAVAGLFFLPAQPSKPADDKNEVRLETATGTLFGTLDLPAGKGQWPVVLIIAGSGPTDRDGNQPFMKNDSLRLVGKALAAQGVAALRYDKRSVAKSAAAGAIEEKLKFEDYIDDAAGWVKQLRGDQRFNKVIILGHSEGSLIGILVAKREKIDALIAIEGAGRDLATLLRDQLKRNLPAAQFEQSSHIIDELLAGRKVDAVPAELTVLFRPSVQPFLMTWLKYDPAKEIAGVKIPVLIVQGTTDLQVSTEDAKLLVAGNKNARLATIESMNHVLKSAPTKSLTEQAAAYSDPTLPLAPRLIGEITAFLKSLKLASEPQADSR